MIMNQEEFGDMTTEKLVEALEIKRKIDIVNNDITNLKKFLDKKNYPVVRIKTPNDSTLEYQLLGETLIEVIDLLVQKEMSRLVRFQNEFENL